MQTYGGGPRRNNDLLAAIGLLLLAALLLVNHAAGQASPYPDDSVIIHVVQPRDTLWGLAEEHFPDRDPRRVIDAIERLNPGVSRGLRVGDEIRVPRRVK